MNIDVTYAEDASINANRWGSCKLLARLKEVHGTPAPRPKPDIVKIVPVPISPAPEAKDETVVSTWFEVLEPKRGDYPSIREIQIAVCKHYDMKLTDILSFRRTANIVRPRQVAMFLSRELTLRSLPEIGRRFGGKDHTTVLHSIRVIKCSSREDANLAHDIAILIEAITGVQQ